MSKKVHLELEPITDGLDQPMKIKAITFAKSFQAIDLVLKEAKRTKSDTGVTALLANFATANQVIGISLAKLLYGAFQIWPEITGVTYKDGAERRMHFTQTMFSKYGYSKTRVERYLLAWEFLVRHEKTLDKVTKERFLSRPIKDLIALGQNCNEAGDFTAAQLKTLAATEDNSTLRQNVAKIRTGEETNAKVLTYSVDASGTITAWESGQREDIGYLGLLDPENDPSSLRQRAISRLMRRGQIKESDHE